MSFQRPKSILKYRITRKAINKLQGKFILTTDGNTGKKQGFISSFER